MNQKRIYLSPPNIGEDELLGITSALQSGWVAPVGPALDEFEHQLGKLYQDKEVLVVNSGTAALHLALKLCGVIDGDHVITSSFTFAACANVILYERAIPVFLDSEGSTWNLDPDLLEEYLSTCEVVPKALIVTHLYGMPAQMDQILRVAREYKIKVIEDAAEALGARIGDQSAGGLADYGILSFNGNKIITTSGGGALICDASEKKRGLHLATQANSGEYGYDHREVGYNYRLSNILAGLGTKQLARLDDFKIKKRQIFSRYQDELGQYFDFLKEPNGYESNGWLSAALLKDEDKSTGDLIQFLEEQNIESRELWKPLHLHEVYAAYQFIGKGVCEKIYERGICLPSGTGLSANEQKYVIDQIKRWIAQ